jgi:hypothetical protein
MLRVELACRGWVCAPASRLTRCPRWSATRSCLVALAAVKWAFWFPALPKHCLRCRTEAEHPARSHVVRSWARCRGWPEALGAGGCVARQPVGRRCSKARGCGWECLQEDPASARCAGSATCSARETTDCLCCASLSNRASEAPGYPQQHSEDCQLGSQLATHHCPRRCTCW